MRLHRFYVVQPLGEEVVIDDVSLVSQWTKVFRYRESDFVILFNGDGNDYCYSITCVTKNNCTLRREKEKTRPSFIPTKKTYLYVATIKKDLFELVTQKATELGVTDIVPLLTERTEKKQLDVVRLNRIIKEASEQSGRGDLTVLHEPIPLTGISAHLSLHNVVPARTFATTLLGRTFLEILQNKSPDENTACAFIIGPEGGWTGEEELFLEKQTFIRISLGATTLRAETSAIVSAFLSTLL